MESAMFLKRCTRRKLGKTHAYWALVETVRTARGPRHRLVSYVGELGSGERRGWARLATILDGKSAAEARQIELFEPEAEGESPPVPEHIEVRLKGVRIERSRDYGDVIVGLMLWRMLGFNDLLEKALPLGTADVPWAQMACVLTLARFLEPRSELYVEEQWYRRTSLSTLLGVRVEAVTDTRLYRTLDHVLPLKTAIEKHLKERIGQLFAPDFDVLLYDVTSTYFEGLAMANPQARHGHSRDHRGDCKQVCIGLVATTDGYPLGYEVFDGNRVDVTTVEDIVAVMEAKYGKARRVWVVDRGMVSEENLAFLRERGGAYVVGTPRSQLRDFERALLDQGWSEVEPGVEVKTVPSPEGEETFVLCRSADRRAKERAMHDRFVARIEEGLKKAENRLQHSTKRVDRGALERQLGRLLGKNSRASGAFRIDASRALDRASRLRLTWSVMPEWKSWADLSDGCYLLRTNLVGKSPQDLWRTYVQLTDVEEVFRTEKTDLRIRPIWHHKQDRVQAHILFSFLAYALWKLLQSWMDKSGLGHSARTLLQELRAIKANDVILPTSTGKAVKLCCATHPDEHLKVLLDKMGIKIPARVGRPCWVPDPSECHKTNSEM